MQGSMFSPSSTVTMKKDVTLCMLQSGMTKYTERGTVLVTKHALCDGKSECRSASHSPTGGEVGQLSPQHLNNHLIIKGQVEMMLINELRRRKECNILFTLGVIALL